MLKTDIDPQEDAQALTARLAVGGRPCPKLWNSFVPEPLTARFRTQRL